MKILITGKNGQVGYFVSKNFPSAKSTDRSELNLACNESIRSFFQANGQFDLIINCAAYTQVDKAEDETEIANQVNGYAVGLIAKLNPSAHIIHFSTDYVFNGESLRPYYTLDPVKPINAYGASKLLGERLLTENAYSYSLIRTSWVYSSIGNNFVKTMLRLTNTLSQIKVVADQVGSPTSAFELAKYVSCNYKSMIGQRQLLHLCDLGTCSWYELAEHIARQARTNCEVLPIPSSEFPTKAKRPKNSRLFNHGKLPEWKVSVNNVIKELRAR